MIQECMSRGQKHMEYAGFNYPTNQWVTRNRYTQWGETNTVM